MNVIIEGSSEISDEEHEGLLAEYNSLRSEINEGQGKRLQIISFTISALGVILSITGGIVLGSQTLDAYSKLLIATGGAIAAYVIIIPSLIMLISVQKSIQRLGGYIRIFIEPLVPGLNWETRWQDFKNFRGYRGGLRGIGKIYYFLSVLPLLLPIYALSQYWWGWFVVLVLLPFILWSIYLTHDLLHCKSADWKWSRWEDYVRERA